MDEKRGHFIVLFFNTTGQRDGEVDFSSGFWFPTARTVFLFPHPEPGGGRANADSCSPFRLHVTPLSPRGAVKSRLSLPVSPSSFLPPLPCAWWESPCAHMANESPAQTSSRATNSGRSVICQPGCILGADCEAARSSQQRPEKRTARSYEHSPKFSFEFGPFNRSLWWEVQNVYPACVMCWLETWFLSFSLYSLGKKKKRNPCS